MPLVVQADLFFLHYQGVDAKEWLFLKDILREGATLCFP